MLRAIVQVGHPVLRQQARALAPDELASPELQQLIADMRDTMRAAPGVGLAAPQIGESIQLAVIDDIPDVVPFHVLVNPTLVVRTEDIVTAYEHPAARVRSPRGDGVHRPRGHANADDLG
jgi:peptide deformylase